MCWFHKEKRRGRRALDRNDPGQFYRWRKELRGVKADQVKREELEAENARLRKAASDLTLDKMILAEAARGNF